MLVCHCQRVSDREIRACAGSTGVSLGAVCRQSGAGTGCGGCIPLVRQLVREAREAAAGAGPPHIQEPTASAGLLK